MGAIPPSRFSSMKRKQIKDVKIPTPYAEWWENEAVVEMAGIPKAKIKAKVDGNYLIIEGHSSYRYLRYEIALDNFSGNRNSFSIFYTDGLLLINYEKESSIKVS
jgi:HSP20 family molecular chaperone IbpA